MAMTTARATATTKYCIVMELYLQLDSIHLYNVCDNVMIQQCIQCHMLYDDMFSILLSAVVIVLENVLQSSPPL